MQAPDRQMWQLLMSNVTMPQLYSPPSEDPGEPRLPSGHCFPMGFFDKLLEPDVPLDYVSMCGELIASRCIHIPSARRRMVPSYVFQSTRPLSLEDLELRLGVDTLLVREIHGE